MQRNYNLTPNFNFDYSVSDFDKIDTTDFFDAINETTKIIYTEALNSNLNKIGLCLSGVDSELIAHYLNKNNIPVEYFFLHIPNINDKDLELCKNIAKKYNTHLNVLSIPVNKIIDTNIYENFNITYSCWPTYVTIPSLIKEIPDDFYIVLGEGDLEKTNNDRYKKIFDSKVKNYSDSNLYIPLHLTEIAYNRTLSFYSKRGESNFYSKNFNLWYHILRHKDLISNFKYFYDPKSNIISEFSIENNLISPKKTLNYNSEHFDLSKKIFTNLCAFAAKYENWNPYIGDIVVLPKNLLS
jgi:hypothetical protein